MFFHAGTVLLRLAGQRLWSSSTSLAACTGTLFEAQVEILKTLRRLSSRAWRLRDLSHGSCELMRAAMMFDVSLAFRWSSCQAACSLLRLPRPEQRTRFGAVGLTSRWHPGEVRDRRSGQAGGEMKCPANEQPVIPPGHPRVGHRQIAPQCLQKAREPGCCISDEVKALSWACFRFAARQTEPLFSTH